MSSTLLGASLVAYFVASALYLANLHIKNRSVAGYGTAAAVLGFLMQTVRIALQAAAHTAPHSNAQEAISFLAWATVGTYLVIVWRYRIPAVGALSLPLSVIALALSYRFRSPGAQHLPGGVLISIHVMSIIASLALFIVAGCGAVFYLVQNKLLKSKKFHGMFRRLPPLQTVDSVAYHLAAIGFPLLTLGIVTGVVGVENTGLRSQASSFRLLAAGATWVVYAAYLLAHGCSGWRGKRANWILCIGAILIGLTTAMHRLM